MKKLLTLLVMVVLLLGVCRHKAIYCGLVMGERYHVRIVSGITITGSRHAQAQAYIDGSWKWLVMDKYVVKTGKQEHQWLLNNYGYHTVIRYTKRIKIH
jgi:hypothetical protein